jgi:hypothetical protein
MIGLTMSTTNLTSKALPLSNEIGLLRIVEIASLVTSVVSSVSSA